MPRIAAYRKKYMLSDFSKWVRNRLFELKITQEEAGGWIGKSQPAFYSKLKSNKFTLSDAITLWEKLGATDEEILKHVKI